MKGYLQDYLDDFIALLQMREHIVRGKMNLLDEISAAEDDAESFIFTRFVQRVFDGWLKIRHHHWMLPSSNNLFNALQIVDEREREIVQINQLPD